jgi:hypothetical protein
MLLNIDSLNRCRQPELLKSYVIESFDRCFEVLSPDEKQRVVEFVKNQMSIESPKTRKTARLFIDKWKQ